MNNIQQDFLDFQLKTTSDLITPAAGLSIFAETVLAAGLINRIKQLFPAPGSNRGVKAHEYIMSILLMLIGGGKYMEDIRKIRLDSGLLKLCKIRRVPAPDSIASWLKDRKNLKRLKVIIEHLNKEVIKRSKLNEFTLDTDVTFIETTN